MSGEIRSVDDIDPKYSEDYSDGSFWEKAKGVIKTAGLPLVYTLVYRRYSSTTS